MENLAIPRSNGTRPHDERPERWGAADCQFTLQLVRFDGPGPAAELTLTATTLFPDLDGHRLLTYLSIPEARELAQRILKHCDRAAVCDE
ncbi:MAG: hypothetical protein ACRDSF_03155 [Pseudonocardiaceae bacterium]